MDQLQQARAQIDEIDAKMAALFEQRMQAAVSYTHLFVCTPFPNKILRL